ncbi:hypothetical protein [Paenibacillus sp. Soil787]|uniref:hypothetical protein n=1 Tax=Paenibacillus sp. Soil787 TaxID=1736411 RepID=UPI0006FCB118|nr:hypothetical protein [Paenibacillus sp. Soil787]KRF31652.1 hypothetical protein ASG93_04735 [Paenibacillus sp. Soil787]
MKKIKLLLLVCIVLVSLSACTKDNVLSQSSNNTQQQTLKTNTPATEPVVVGTSTTPPPAITQQPTKDTESIVYENTKYNFVLKIPKSWDGKYDVVENADGLRFVYKANKNGTLFSITLWSKEKWSTDGAELAKNIHISKIGEMEDKIYTLSTPTDVQVDPSDKKMTADYASMWEDIEGIKGTFEFKK